MAAKRISLRFMPRKPRVTRGSQDRRRRELAERFHHLARVAGGPDATFEHQQDAAAALAAEVLADLGKDAPEIAGTGERGTASCPWRIHPRD